MKLYIQKNPDRIPCRPGRGPTPGVIYPYMVNFGFPAGFTQDLIDRWRENDSTIDEQFEAASPGMVVIDNPTRTIYAIDVDGNAVFTGLVLPSEAKPQPLEIDEDDPFWKAARRAQERMDKQTTDDIEEQEAEEVKA